MNPSQPAAELESRFEKLVPQYGRLIRSAVLEVGGAVVADRAEDIGQRVLLEVGQGSAREPAVDHSSSYVYRAAVRETVRTARGAMRRSEEPLEDGRGASPHLGEDDFERLSLAEASPFERAASLRHIEACSECARIHATLEELESGARGFDPGVPRAAEDVRRLQTFWIGLAAATALVLSVAVPWGGWLARSSEATAETLRPPAGNLPGGAVLPEGAARLCGGHVAGAPGKDGLPGPHIVWVAYTSPVEPRRIAEGFAQALGRKPDAGAGLCPSWRFPSQGPEGILEVCPILEEGPWSQCETAPAGTQSVIVASSLARAE